MKINWFELPYDHKGKWHKIYEPTIGDKEKKITWPQKIVEYVVLARKKYWKTPKWANLPLIDGWSKSISKETRGLIQQVYVICNYFPHPEENSLVKTAFIKYFTQYKPTKIGQYRKVRYKNVGIRQISTITQDEKDLILGISCMLQSLEKIDIQPREIVIKKGPISSRIDQYKKQQNITNALLEKAK